VLSGANTFTGQTNIAGGTLRFGVANALATSGVVMSAGALDLAGFNPSILGLRSDGATAPVVTNSAPGTGTNTLSITGGFFGNYSGSIQDGATAKTAVVVSGTNGRIAWAGTNTFTGGLTINGNGVANGADTGVILGINGDAALGATSNVVTITRSSVTVGSSVTVAISGGSALAGTDYVNDFPKSIPFNIGDTTLPVPITLLDDFTLDGNQTLQLSIITHTGGNISTPSVATLTLGDNDAAELGGNSPDLNADEGNLSDVGLINIQLTVQPTGIVTVNLTPDAQCNVIPSSLVFDSTTWSIAQSVTVTAVNDLVAEGVHTCNVAATVDIPATTDATFHTATAFNTAITIADNDSAALNLIVTDATVTEEGEQGQGRVHELRAAR
jgi:hypothetical protein